MFKKLAKELYRLGLCIGSGIHTFNERKQNSDPEIKQYVRSKRSYKNLPSNWTNTRWIRLDKSWKSRSKVRHQWEKHELSKKELDDIYDYSYTKQQLLYKLSRKNEIVLCDMGKTFYPPIDYFVSKAAESLVADGLVEPIYKEYSWTFEDFGEIQTYSQKILVGIKVKETNQ